MSDVVVVMILVKFSFACSINRIILGDSVMFSNTRVLSVCWFHSEKAPWNWVW